jgi:ADP-glucose pyrophosphorylase
LAAERPKLLALVLAGGEGGRLEPLTAERAKPALPFAGVYRLIDFPLSNCVHSGIEDVWVSGERVLAGGQLTGIRSGRGIRRG